MSVKVKIKLTGKDAADMAQDPRVAKAFHEVTKNPPAIVKHTREKFGKKRAAKQRVAIALSKARAAGAHVPNYMSRDDLHVPVDATSGARHAGERVPYKSRPDLTGMSAQETAELVGDETRQVAAPEGFGPSYAGEGFVGLAVTKREMNPVERARQRNNRVRDARTNLGRGKQSVVETE